MQNVYLVYAGNDSDIGRVCGGLAGDRGANMDAVDTGL